MKDRIRAAGLLSAAFLGLAQPAAAEDMVFSGTVESDLRVARLMEADGRDGGYSFGFEQYANLRMQSRAGEKGTFNAAVNLVAASGSSVPVGAEGASFPDSPAAPFVSGKGYAYALELERLYFRIEEDAFDAEAGLLRLAFGFGQAWSPSDFLIARNPLLPDARPRGILGIAVTAYPADDWQSTVFAAAGSDPLASDGDDSVAGLSAEYHARRGSLQALYAVKAASSGARDAVHRWGLSVKGDAVIGIALDALYTLDGKAVRTDDWHGLDWEPTRGLAAAVGADYSFLDGDLYLLVQYLYSGGGALDPREGFGPRNYLYAAAAYRVDDYTQATLDCGASLDDLSAVPSLAVSREPFQGMTLSLTGSLPLDARTFSSTGDRGEFGPVASGRSYSLSAKAKLRF